MCPPRGRLYYTVSGDSTLYYRYFEPENNVIGGQTFTAGRLPSAVTSMTIAGGKLYYTTAAGLSSIAFANGVTSGSPTWSPAPETGVDAHCSFRVLKTSRGVERGASRAVVDTTAALVHCWTLQTIR